jgi:hypothetical protein
MAEGSVTLACEPDLGGVPKGFQILTDGMSATETSSPIFDSNMPEELAARLPSMYAE